MRHPMSPRLRQGASRHGIPVIIVAMVAAGLGYQANPEVAKWIIFPLVLILWLALLTTIVHQSARHQSARRDR